MSGSDGPDPAPGQGSTAGGAPFGGDDSCSTLSLHAAVENPDPALDWEVGNRFSVALGDDAPLIIALIGDDGDPVGAIRPLPRLIRCLRADFKYEAVVVRADGGDIEVQVDPEV